MKIVTCLFSLFFLLGNISAQVSGLVTDTEGEPLAFANVYVKGSTQGTTTNPEGNYTINLDQGEYILVFQYVGYQPVEKSITVSAAKKQLDVQLVIQAMELTEAIVKADAEDPAYAVIRQAIKKRKYYLGLVENYKCDVYIKGIQRLLDAPEKIMGQEIGDMGGTLDSNRQGIVYLSESLAELYYQKPDQKKEIMISSKVSGNDNGFSFNRASLMDFSFYEEYIEIERQLLSPIADNALSYYRYKLEGTFYNKSGQLINRIKVIPKRPETPTFGGYIYITEDLWNIHSVDLFFTGLTIKQDILDTVTIKQVHVPVKEPDVWMQISQTINFDLGILGFKIRGTFSGVYSDYEINTTLPDNLFRNETFKVLEGANDKALIYWDSIRPIPLTEVEAKDYVRKDSLQLIWDSKEYKDSIDRKSNRFSVWDILTGYSYRNSYERRFFSISSPLTTVSFNTVQGFYANVNISYRKEDKEDENHWYRINPQIQYGLADKQLRPSLALTYNVNAKNYARFDLSGGRTTAQINESEPITLLANTFYSLFFKRNYARFLDKRFIKGAYRQELKNGVFGFFDLEYAEKEALTNNSDYSVYNKGRTYFPNEPIIGENETAQFDKYQLLKLGLSIRFRPGQKFMTYPKRKYIMGSRYPDFIIQYRKAIDLGNNFANYDLIKLSIKDDYTVGLVGRSEYQVQGGIFLNDNNVPFPEYQHFNGNEIEFARSSSFKNGFLQLPYYEYSTNGAFVQGHFQHFFNGFLLDKVPLLRRTGWKSVLGIHALKTDHINDPYYEFSFGFENIGYKLFRLLRFDLVASFRGRDYQGLGWVISVNM